MDRRSVLKTGVAAVATASWLRPAAAQAAGDAIRPLTILTIPQAADPHAYQAAEIMADAFKQLGLDVSLKPLSGQEQAQIVWYERQRWDATMWSMVGRPERSDPDELTYNLFVSANAATGYDFVGYVNPAYDKLAQDQRSELDQNKRRALIMQSQELINHDQPYGYLVHPINLFAFNTDIFDEKTAVEQPGIGIRNFWTFLSLTPKGGQRDIIVNSSVPSGKPQPVQHRRRDRMVDRRPGVGPVDAHRAGRVAAAVGGRDRDAPNGDHRRIHIAQRHEVARRPAGDRR